MPVRYYDWIAHFGRRTPDKIAVIDLASERRLSYAQFDRRIARLASHLRDALNVTRGDRVAVLALNSTDTLEVQFACFRIGAVFLPLNNRLTVPELQFIVGDASPTVMIHDSDLAETALTVAKLCNVASALQYGPDGSYEAGIAAAKPLESCESVTLDDISTIMYTSGTTGQPKGAIITHGMTFWNCVNLGGPAYISPATVLLTVLPLFHTGGLNCYTNPVLHSGGTVLIMRAFDPGLALQLISDATAWHQPVLRRARDLPVHVAACFVRVRRFLPARDRRRRRRADAGAAAEGVGRARRRAATGLRHDRNQPGRADARQGRRGAQGRLLRQAGHAHGSADRSPRRHRTPLSTNSANSGSADPTSRPATGTGRTPTHPPSPTAGCTPATPRGSTRKASTTSSTAGRTCTFPAARTSIRPRSKAYCIKFRRLPKPPSSASRTRSGARSGWRSSL